jgi:hypothetical protein
MPEPKGGHSHVLTGILANAGPKALSIFQLKDSVSGSLIALPGGVRGTGSLGGIACR